MGYSPQGHKTVGQDLATKQQQSMCQKGEQTAYTGEKGLKGKECPTFTLSAVFAEDHRF